jgi:hypothetical protein
MVVDSVGHWVESKAELMVVDWVGQKDAVKVA